MKLPTLFFLALILSCTVFAQNETAYPEFCFDNIQNNNETDIDCGGSCPKCQIDMNCEVNSDCTTNACGFVIPLSDGIEFTVNTCQNTNCSDGIQNGDEEGIDCGGSCQSCSEESVVVEVQNNEQPREPAINPEEKESSSLLIWLLFIVIIVISGFIVFIIIGTAQLKSKKKRNIATFVYRHLQRGRHPAKIRSFLIQKGFSQKQINHAFIGANKTLQKWKR